MFRKLKSFYREKVFNAGLNIKLLSASFCYVPWKHHIFTCTTSWITNFETQKEAIYNKCADNSPNCILWGITQPGALLILLAVVPYTLTFWTLSLIFKEEQRRKVFLGNSLKWHWFIIYALNLFTEEAPWSSETKSFQLLVHFIWTSCCWLVLAIVWFFLLTPTEILNFFFSLSCRAISPVESCSVFPLKCFPWNVCGTGPDTDQK